MSNVFKKDYFGKDNPFLVAFIIQKYDLTNLYEIINNSIIEMEGGLIC